MRDIPYHVLFSRTDILFHVVDGSFLTPILPGVVIPKLEDHPQLGMLLVLNVEVSGVLLPDVVIFNSAA